MLPLNGWHLTLRIQNLMEIRLPVSVVVQSEMDWNQTGK